MHLQTDTVGISYLAEIPKLSQLEILDLNFAKLKEADISKQ